MILVISINPAVVHKRQPLLFKYYAVCSYTAQKNYVFSDYSAIMEMT